MSILNSYKTLSELFFVSDGQGVLLKNHPLDPRKTFIKGSLCAFVLFTAL